MSLKGAELSVICDDCHKAFIVCVRKERFQSIEGDVWCYNCPHCGKLYVSYIDDSLTRHAQSLQKNGVLLKDILAKISRELSARQGKENYHD